MKPSIIVPALSIGAAAVLLAACGGSQPPIGAPGASPQVASPPNASTPIGAKVRLSSNSLLYVSSAAGANVYVYSLPDLGQVFQLSSLNQFGSGECTDSSGDVFITTASSAQTGTIFEYAHGGSSPIQTLDDPGYPFGCSMDPTAGDLAVSNITDNSNPSDPGYSDIAVYKNAEGSPTIYTSPKIGTLYYCGYDNAGNLYLDGADDATGKHVLFEVANGSATVSEINIAATVKMLGPVQWDGKSMTLVDYNNSVAAHGPELIHRLKIENGTATVVGTTKLTSLNNRHGGQTWIQGNEIVAIDNKNNTGVGLWKYPKGGKNHKQLQNLASELTGVTISVASSH